VISLIRNSWLSKGLWSLMSIYLLNISVDAVDPEANYIPEDLSYNEQESIAEIIVEKFLGYENAFKEFDDNDSDERNQQNTLSFEFFISQDHSPTGLEAPIIEITNLFKDYNFTLTLGFEEIDNPPPIV